MKMMVIKMMVKDDMKIQTHMVIVMVMKDGDDGDEDDGGGEGGNLLVFSGGDYLGEL